MKESLSRKLCSCIKKVRESRKNKTEKPAIAICVKSVLQTRGKTIKKFRCRNKRMLEVQNLKSKHI